MKKRRINAVSRPVEFVFHLSMFLFCLACIIPFIFVIIISFSSQESIREIGYSFVPTSWSLEAYSYIWKLGDQLWRSYFNSFFITAAGTIFSLLVTILYSYALYRKDFKYRKFFTFFCFFTMIFGGGLAPTFVVCKTVLGLSDSYAAIKTYKKEESGNNVFYALVSPGDANSTEKFLKLTVTYNDGEGNPTQNNVVKGGKQDHHALSSMVRSQNDLYMVVNNNGAEINAMGDDILEALDNGKLTIGELQRSAKNICRFILNAPVMKRPLRPLEEVKAYEPLQGAGSEGATGEPVWCIQCCCKIYFSAVKSGTGSRKPLSQR